MTTLSFSLQQVVVEVEEGQEVEDHSLGTSRTRFKLGYTNGLNQVRLHRPSRVM